MIVILGIWKIFNQYRPQTLVKRLRGILISDTREMTLIKIPLNKSGLLVLDSTLFYLLNPHDYQNVPFVVDLFNKLKTIQINSNDKVITNDLRKEVACLYAITQSLLNIFVNPTIDLCDQLSQLAFAAHLLFYIYKKWRGKVLNIQLYTDIQDTIQDAFWVTVKMRHSVNRNNIYL